MVSKIVVLALGCAVTLLSMWGLMVPDRLMALVQSTMDRHWGIYFAVFVRLALGLALISVAPVSLFPFVFQVLGWLAIVAAVVLAIAGRERIRRFIGWWSERFSASTIRLWLVFGMAFGAFLVYGVL